MCEPPISSSRIRDYEARRHSPQADRAEALARALGVDVLDLYGLRDAEEDEDDRALLATAP